jgi:hypothetical protein
MGVLHISLLAQDLLFRRHCLLLSLALFSAFDRFRFARFAIAKVFAVVPNLEDLDGERLEAGSTEAGVWHVAEMIQHNLQTNNLLASRSPVAYATAFVRTFFFKHPLTI